MPLSLKATRFGIAPSGIGGLLASGQDLVEIHKMVWGNVVSHQYVQRPGPVSIKGISGHVSVMEPKAEHHLVQMKSGNIYTGPKVLPLLEYIFEREWMGQITEDRYVRNVQAVVGTTKD
jgi:hypothetical protein